MLKALKNLLLVNDSNKRDQPMTDAFAVTCLMVEASTMDGHVDPIERETIVRLLTDHFKETAEDAMILLQRAEKHIQQAQQILPLTKRIKDQYDEDGRIEIIELIWEVILADGVLHAYEDNLMRRIGALIYVSDRDRGIAKQRVIQKLGLEDCLTTEI